MRAPLCFYSTADLNCDVSLGLACSAKQLVWYGTLKRLLILYPLSRQQRKLHANDSVLKCLDHSIRLIKYTLRINSGQPYYKVHTKATKRSLQRPDYKVQTTDCKLQSSDYKLETTHYKLQTTNYKLQTRGYKLQITNYRYQTIDYKLQITIYRLQTTNHNTTNYKLQT